MCGRFTLAADPRKLARTFDLPDVPDLPPRYNVALGQSVAMVGLKADGSSRGLALMTWGFIPRGTTDPKGGRKPVNARAETAHRLPTFRDSFARRRCLVPADGFYEWQRAGLAKVPHHFRLTDGGVMALAGLWDVWTDPGGKWVRTCCVLTTEPNAVVQPVHPRMPVVLPAEAWAAWLDPATPVAQLQRLLTPLPAERLTSIVVGPAVNSVTNDGPECVRPGGRPGHVAAWTESLV